MSEKSLSPHFDSVRFLADASQQPGIYQMFGVDGNILYVGKAKNLKARLASYFRRIGLSTKTIALVARIHRIEVTITASEAEALILEQNLIKSNRPPYNISLRDDKSYPYIQRRALSAHEFSSRRKEKAGRLLWAIPQRKCCARKYAFFAKNFSCASM